MSDLPLLFSPIGLLLWYVWNVAVLSSIQLTVRLIRAFSVPTTLVAALALTIGSLPIAWLFHASVGSSFGWYPPMMVLTGLLGFAIAHFALRIKRLRGRVVAAFGVAILSGPWPLFFERLPRWG